MRIGWLAIATLVVCACDARAQVPRTTPAPKIAETAYEKGFQSGWLDYGYSPRKDPGEHPQQHNLSNYGGWILARPSPTRAAGGVVFSYQAPADFGSFIEVRLVKAGAGNSDFHHVRLKPMHLRSLSDGWVEAYVPITELNPGDRPFDQIYLFAYKDVPKGWVTFDHVGLTAPEARIAPKAQAASAAVSATIDCAHRTHHISPLVYGIAYYPMTEYSTAQQWKLGATARRWGGNQTTRYNWELGNAWNAGSDWYFRNLNYVNANRLEWDAFLQSTTDHQMATSITVPTIGWVAKDTTSFSFPIAVYPVQENIETSSGAGNGKDKKGQPLKSPSPEITSKAAPPEYIARWVKAMLEADKAKKRSRPVRHYILDNEPALWDQTHRDLHPNGVSYDELLKRAVDYGTAIRKADPSGVIAGPAEWGWTNYFSSAADRHSGGVNGPDRKSHGGSPLIPWYLAQLREYEKKSGVKAIDLLDLHFYPQVAGVGLGEGGDISDEGAERRLRSTRGLWDPTYRDESWIDEPVMLIPRMKKWIAESYPGLGTSIGEWNFGAERHISGGLAVAEALGRFGQLDLTSAYYWSYPADESPAFWAFRAYRNYDGKGAHFQDWSLPTRAAEGTSLFASASDDGSLITAVALNLSPSQTITEKISLEGSGLKAARRMFTFATGSVGLAEGKPPADSVFTLPPYSLTIIEWAK